MSIKIIISTPQCIIIIMKNYDELFLTTTDTVVGLGAPVSLKNLHTINNLKQSPQNKKLVIMVSSFEEAKKLKNWNIKADDFARKNWPGPVTIVINEKLAVRVPDNLGLRELLEKKGPCYMTSANLSGQKPLSLEEAIQTFQEVKQHYDFGNASGKVSKIIDFETRKVLR